MTCCAQAHNRRHPAPRSYPIFPCFLKRFPKFVRRGGGPEPQIAFGLLCQHFYPIIAA
jgi:hypothetical protein